MENRQIFLFTLLSVHLSEKYNVHVHVFVTFLLGTTHKPWKVTSSII